MLTRISARSISGRSPPFSCGRGNAADRLGGDDTCVAERLIVAMIFSRQGADLKAAASAGSFRVGSKAERQVGVEVQLMDRHATNAYFL